MVEYVCATTHPDNPAYEGSKTPDGEFSSTLEEDVQATCRTINFQSLKILSAEEVQGREEDGPEAEETVLKVKVDFCLTGQKGFRQNKGKTQSLTEMARFVRPDSKSRWLYLGGEYL